MYGGFSTLLPETERFILMKIGKDLRFMVGLRPSGLLDEAPSLEYRVGKDLRCMVGLRLSIRSLTKLVLINLTMLERT